MKSLKSRSGIHSQKFVQKRRRARQTLLFLVVLCFLTVTASIILLLRVPLFQIKSVSVDGSTLTPPETVSAAALSSLSGNYFKIIPLSNSFVYSKSAIAAKVAADFKEVKEVQVKRSGLSSLHISVIERTPAAVLCVGFHEDEALLECYLTDDHGYVFAAAASTTVYSDLNHYYIPSETATTTIGEHFIKEDRFNSLQKFVNGAEKSGLEPQGVLVGEGGQYEMYIKNKKGDSEVTVYFDERSPFEKTLENLVAFWNNSNKDTLGSTRATTTPAFDYINLRFGNAVYYSTQ